MSAIKQNLKQESTLQRRNSLLSSVNDNLSKIEHRGHPLRVIDDNTTYESLKQELNPPPKPNPPNINNQLMNKQPPLTTMSPKKYPLKTAQSQPILGNLPKTGGFFANSHNQIQQQRLQSIALKQGFKDVNSLLKNLGDIKISNELLTASLSPVKSNVINNNNNNNPIEKCVSLPLNVSNNTFQSDNLAVMAKNMNNNNKDLMGDSDSGISTPVSPININQSQSEIPLFDSDVQCTFNGTTKLKSIKTGIKCNKA